MDQIKKPFTASMAAYFGKLPGQNLQDFAKELKALSQKEKLEFAAMLREVGINVADPEDLSSKN